MILLMIIMNKNHCKLKQNNKKKLNRKFKLPANSKKKLMKKLKKIKNMKKQKQMVIIYL